MKKLLQWNRLALMSQPILIVLFTLLFGSVFAQIEPQKPFERKGFVFGGAFGLSSIQLNAPTFSESKQIGLSFPNLKFGKMITPRTALLLTLPGTVYRDDWSGRPRDRGFEGIVPAFQYWAGDRFWLLGGIGLGLDAPAFYDIKTEEDRKFYFGKTALAGAGYEFWHRGSFAMDIQARVHYGDANKPEGLRKAIAFSLLLGFNFY